MEVEKYGIRLIPLERDHIEMVRQWRNSIEVKQYMQFKEEITPQMQVEWFNSISNNYNFYSLIEYEGEFIGLSNLKDVDYETRTAEGGIFIANTEFWDSDIPIRAILCGKDSVFEAGKIDVLFAKIARNNFRSIQFNKAFGYKLLPDQEAKEFQRYELTKADYYKQREKLIDLLWN